MIFLSTIRLPLILVFVVLLSPATIADEVYSKNKRGNELFKKGLYEEALRQYDDALLLAPGDSLLKMNKGNTLYHLGRHAEAESLYTAAKTISDPKKRAAAHYNLGNILYRQGEAKLQNGAPAADENFKKALEHYIAALDLRPNDKDAQWNIELTQRRIQQAKQQQQQQQGKDQNKNDQNKDQQDKNQKNQDQQNQDQQDQQEKDDNQNQQNRQNDKDQNQDGQEPRDEQERESELQQSREDQQKEEARRLIRQYADDADSLNKPQQRKGVRARSPEKDW